MQELSLDEKLYNAEQALGLVRAAKWDKLLHPCFRHAPPAWQAADALVFSLFLLL